VAEQDVQRGINRKSDTTAMKLTLDERYGKKDEEDIGQPKGSTPLDYELVALSLREANTNQVRSH
jgi:hypothetical protein